MTTRIVSGLVCAALLTIAVSPANAQSRNLPPAPATPRAPTVAPPPPPPPPQPPAPRKPGQLVNIKTEFTITELRGDGPPVKRSVHLIVADGDSGSIRSQPDVFSMPGGALQLNVDARPDILTGNKIRLGFSLQYDGAPAKEALESGARNPPPAGTILKTKIYDALSLILEDGKSMVVAQSADPTSDRHVTVEVKATIMR